MTGMEVQCSAYFSIWFQQDGLNQTIKTSLPFMSYINLSADVILSQLSPEDIKTMLINCADKTMFSHSCDSSIQQKLQNHILHTFKHLKFIFKFKSNLEMFEVMLEFGPLHENIKQKSHNVIVSLFLPVIS